VIFVDKTMKTEHHYTMKNKQITTKTQVCVLSNDKFADVMYCYRGAVCGAGPKYKIVSGKRFKEKIKWVER